MTVFRASFLNGAVVSIPYLFKNLIRLPLDIQVAWAFLCVGFALHSFICIDILKKQ